MAVIVLSGALIAGAVGYRWAFHDMPAIPEDSRELWRVRMEPTVTLLDREGAVLAVRGPLYGQPARLTELPPHVPRAFLAIEDQRFFEHGGVDWTAMVRSSVVNVRAGRTLQGGSTITMQLVKNLILTPERTLQRKLQEMRIAMALEDRLSKQEILELYLNRIYFGEQAYGIEAAARRYFDKPATELSLQEAALLAALPKAPSRLAPTDNLAEAQARAAIVLRTMRDIGYIDELEYLVAVSTQAEPVEGVFGSGDHMRYGHIFSYAATETARALGPDPDVNDLVIATTIDRDMQAAAVQAVQTRIADEGEAVNASEAALIALDRDGSVRAVVGGIDYAASQFNRATQARRQPGSAFKPVVYAAALEAGYSPWDVFDDSPVDIDGWTPGNFGGGYRGRVTIDDALKRSINTVAARVGMAVGLPQVVDMARRLGVGGVLRPVPSITLGASETRLVDITSAYLVFANDGNRIPPHLITEIRSTSGELVWERPEDEPEAVIDTEDARTMSTMLQAVVREGTGTAARLPDGRPAAGKTGTSQQSRDAWFIGYTANLAAGVWVGNDDDSPMRNVTGGGLPARIWNDFMAAAHEGLEIEQLAAPAPRTRDPREERLAAFYGALSNDLENARTGAAHY